MAVDTYSGVDARLDGDRLIFRVYLQDSSGADVITGAASLRLYELQADGSLKSFDFNDFTFKTTSLTTNTVSLTHRQGNAATYDTGLWTYSLTSIAALTKGGVYFAKVTHSSASPTSQVREFGFGAEKVSLVQILGTFLTETVGGYLAAAFKKFLDVAAPVFTTANINQTGDSYGRIGANGAGLSAIPDEAGVTTLLARLTSARAGYLDNLNISGAVASHADILALNTSASKHLLMATVGQYERPESGNTVYTVEVRTFGEDGADTNADSTPTLTATGQMSGSLAANLGVATNPATGVYRWTYTVGSGATSEPIRFDVSSVISGGTYTLSAYTQVVDEVSQTWTGTDAGHLTAIFNKLPANGIADETLLEAAINALPTNVELAVALAGADDAVLAAIAALNNLSSVGAQAAAAAALAAYGAATGAEVAAVPGQVTTDHGNGSYVRNTEPPSVAGLALETSVQALGSPLQAGDYTEPPTAGEIDTQLSGTHGEGQWDAAGASAPTAAEIWANVTRTLTQPAAAVAAAVSGSTLVIRRGDTFSASLTGLGSIAGRTKLWFTVKRRASEPDADALVQIEETDGLLYLNGESGTAEDGTLTVDDEDAGDVTIEIEPAATATLPPVVGVYDIQWRDAVGAVHTLTAAACRIDADVTRAVE